jgi:acetylornithine/succinyldiaminopimelate/putrescine aminotransferase
VSGGGVDAQRPAAVAERFARHVNRGQMRYLRSGHLDVLESERAGIGFVDAGSGRAYIDCFTSAGCFNVGRRDPAVIAALEAAIDEGLDLGTPDMLSVPRVELSERLASLAPGDLDRVLFAGGGGDAVDCAIKLARGATGRPQIIGMQKGYHGHVGFALSANGKEHYREYFEPLASGFAFVPLNDYEAVADLISSSTAAVLLEPVQGEAGIYVAADDYLRRLRELCDRHGTLLIFDEIQTGLGRTGRLFAAEHSGVVPDIMTLAKSLGGSLFPNAAVLYRDVEPLVGYVATHPDFHSTTTGGSDLGCRVSLAVLDKLVGERLWENAAARGAELTAALEQLRAEHPRLITEVRGRGLMVGVEYAHEFMGPLMSDALSRQGVFAAYSGNAPQVMRFMPPLTVTEREMATIVTAITAAVASIRPLMVLALPVTKIPGVLPLLDNELVQIRLFGLLRDMQDRSREMKERAHGAGGTARDALEKLEPQLQQLVGAMLKAGQAVDRTAGPVVRPAVRRFTTAAHATADQAAAAAGGAGRRVGERLPTTVKEAGASAGTVAREAVTKAPKVARRAGPAAVQAARRTPDAVRQAVPATRDAVTRAASAAADAASTAAVKTRETLPHDREQVRDIDEWGRVIGLLAGRAMDCVAATTDAVARGVGKARKVSGGRSGPSGDVSRPAPAGDGRGPGSGAVS